MTVDPANRGTEMSLPVATTTGTDWYSLSADDAVARLGADVVTGLDADEVQRRISQYGPPNTFRNPH